MLKYNYLKANQPRLFAIQHLLPSFKENLTVKTYSVNLHLPSHFLCLKPILFSILAITSLLTILVNSAHGLNVTTANEIHGSAPYLTYDGGITKADSTESLLGITLSDGKVINALNDESSLTNPIELPHQEDTYASIQTIVPLPTEGNSNYPIVNMTDLLKAPYNYFGDDDGDGYQNSTEGVIATASGNISIKWENINGIDITDIVKKNPKNPFSTCDAPYKLTITASNGELNSIYGQPNKSSFVGGSHSYYIMPKVAPIVCYAQPNLVFDNKSYVRNGFVEHNFDGPLWDTAQSGKDKTTYRGYPSRGFKVIHASNSGNYDGKDSVYKNNFPSTGAHGLYFYLLLKGITPDAVLIANGSKITAVEGGNVSLKLSSGVTEQWWGDNRLNDEPKYGLIEPALKVQLIGPRYNSNNKSFRPVTFKIYADRSKSQLLYEFRLMRWYIAQPNVAYGNKGDIRYWSKSEALSYQAQAKAYCNNLGNGYRLPDTNDFTNANSVDESDYPNWDLIWDGGDPDVWEVFRRQLSYREKATKWQGGIANEWGCLVNKVMSGAYRCSGYPEGDWDGYLYWSTNVVDYRYSFHHGSPIMLASNVGEPRVPLLEYVNHYPRAACVTP